jgi:hypothetical protein
MKTQKKNDKGLTIKDKAVTAKAVDDLEQLLAALPLDDAWNAADRRSAGGYSHVPTEAIQVALDFVARNEGRCPAFDQKAAADAIDYEAHMRHVADLAATIASRVRMSIRMQRVVPVAHVLSLYKWMQGMSRHDGSFTDIVAKLRPLLRTTSRRAKTAPKQDPSAGVTPPNATPPAVDRPPIAALNGVALHPSA